MEKFLELRKKHKEFKFCNYEVWEDEVAIYLDYEFEITDLTRFTPRLRILKKNLRFKSIQSDFVRNMAFQIGLVELISYWKSTCAPKVIIECGKLDEEQIKWWKKLYFYGLGELFYRNKIETSLADFMEIVCTGKEEFTYGEIDDKADGALFLIGGGKDSVVTLETFGIDKSRDYCMIVNPKLVTLACAEIAGFSDERIVRIERKIDQNLLELNRQGMINGHTPFSTMLAFTSYLVAFLLGKKYTVVSNESSANEPSVLGKKINHQYSKSFEFEEDFRWYAKKYLKAPVEYLSFLRPLNELQIAKIFAKLPQYHQVFKSCNVGSKSEEWRWCGKCAKCMFAFVMLAPYLYREKLVKIFGVDMFEDAEMLQVFLQLCGKVDVKPFECVGTVEEVNYAVNWVIRQLEEKGQKLPYLLQYYKDNYGLAEMTEDITLRYNLANNLSDEQDAKLRKAIL